jgi:hypothetical protein
LRKNSKNRFIAVWLPCKARFLIVAVACFLALFANENRLEQREGFSRWLVK